ncbi:hypothetical protein EVAR_20218_1 [Eumeta japonica]|uniref:Uncharacterized protein n=1 Tax=Eumeta variegata TaxID=151549 RepID=A0A4C1W775_EUMVA|nr:hypothetical protein EVAR_20218_1 [Eumeta japonica]
MEWKRDRCVTSQTLRPIVPFYRLFRALARTLGSGGTRQHGTYKKTGTRKINAQFMKVKKDIEDFLENDENSRMCPGKKDFIRSKGEYKNKFMFHVVYRHINDLFPGTTFFSWHYSEPGHGKGAPDGVGGTLKRTADKAIAEGQDIVDLSSLKNILLARCSSIILFEVTTANIAEIEDLVKQSQTITAFRGTQKIRQFVFTDVLEFRSLSCSECEGKCKHFHLGYYSSSNPCIKKTQSISLGRRSEMQTRTKSHGGQSSNDVICTSYKNPTYNIGDHVLIKWDEKVYPGEIMSVFEEGALVKCMKKGTKSWRWPIIKDEQLYHWNDIQQKIRPPTLIKKGCYSVKEIDDNI